MTLPTTPKMNIMDGMVGTMVLPVDIDWLFMIARVSAGRETADLLVFVKSKKVCQSQKHLQEKFAPCGRVCATAPVLMWRLLLSWLWWNLEAHMRQPLTPFKTLPSSVQRGGVPSPPSPASPAQPGVTPTSEQVVKKKNSQEAKTWISTAERAREIRCGRRMTHCGGGGGGS